MIFVFLSVLLTIVGIWFIINSSFPLMAKIIGSIFLLYINSVIISIRLKIDQEFGILMVKSKKGLDELYSLAKFKKFWNIFGDLGLVLGFGLMSWFIIKENKIKTILVGLLFGLLILTISPYAENVLAHILHKEIPKTNSFNLVPYIVFVLFGFSGSAFLALFLNSLNIVVMIINNIFTNTQETVQPGVSLIIPGLNLPLFEGIIALILLLVIHESAHAILAVVGGIPLLSAGVVLFGFIPIGAFVEPNERALFFKTKEIQNRVYIAGPTANFFLSLFSFILFLIFIFITNPKTNGFMEFEYENPILNSIYLILALTFSLNFVVGLINLLPVSFLDGGRIYENILNKKVYLILSNFTILLFLINVLPWFL